MRIAVIAYNLRVAGGLSVGRNVVSALGRVADHHEYLMVLPAGVGYEELDKPSRTTCRYYRRGAGALGQLLCETFAMPGIVRAFTPDVTWGLGNFGLVRPYAAQAVLLHFPHLVYDPRSQRRRVWKRNLRVKFAARRLRRCLPATQLVFCQTPTMAERFQKVYNYRGRVAVMPNAVSRATTAGSAAPPAIFERFQGKFVLFCLTRYYVHKNLEILLDVFREYYDQLSDVRVLTTIASEQHPGARRFLEQLDEPVLGNHIINVGPIDQRKLAGYFLHSDALLLPTVLESFSGTYLEAMQFGRPILTSDMDFAHDVCGPAACYFDPFDPASIRDAILALRDMPGKRGVLVAEGAKRFESYVRDWDSIVREAIQKLERLS